MAGIAEGVVDEEVRQLKAELERQLERTRVFLEKAIKEGRYDRSIEAARATAAEIADILARNFNSVNAGFEAASAKVEEATLSDLANAGVTASFSAVSVASLRAQVDGTLTDITTIAGEAARELQDVIVDVVRSNVQPTEAIDRLMGVVSGRTAEVATLVDTGLAAFDREVSVVAASEAGVEWFLYDGPLDQLTRPYLRRPGREAVHAREARRHRQRHRPEPTVPLLRRVELPAPARRARPARGRGAVPGGVTPWHTRPVDSDDIDFGFLKDRARSRGRPGAREVERRRRLIRVVPSPDEKEAPDDGLRTRPDDEHSRSK